MPNVVSIGAGTAASTAMAAPNQPVSSPVPPSLVFVGARICPVACTFDTPTKSMFCVPPGSRSTKADQSRRRAAELDACRRTAEDRQRVRERLRRSDREDVILADRTDEARVMERGRTSDQGLRETAIDEVHDARAGDEIAEVGPVARQRRSAPLPASMSPPARIEMLRAFATMPEPVPNVPPTCRSVPPRLERATAELQRGGGRYGHLRCRRRGGRGKNRAQREALPEMHRIPPELTSRSTLTGRSYLCPTPLEIAASRLRPRHSSSMGGWNSANHGSATSAAWSSAKLIRPYECRVSRYCGMSFLRAESLNTDVFVAATFVNVRKATAEPGSARNRCSGRPELR